jgi:hypothetical protein
MTTTKPREFWMIQAGCIPNVDKSYAFEAAVYNQEPTHGAIKALCTHVIEASALVAKDEELKEVTRWRDEAKQWNKTLSVDNLALQSENARLRECNEKYIALLDQIGAQAKRESNGRTEYWADGYNHILKLVKEALSGGEV